MSALPQSAPPVVDRAELIARRERFLSPSLRTFPLFPDDPLVLVRGEGQYVFDETGRRYLDGTAQNVCISLGFGHPVTQRMAWHAMKEMQHCTSLFFHDAPARYAEELVARMPEGGDWVVHLVNSGAEAIDLAVLVARLYTGHFDLLTLRNSYHGMHFGTMAASGLALCHQPLAGAPGYVHVHNPDLYRGAYKDDVDGYVDDIRRVIDSSTSGAVAAS